MTPERCGLCNKNVERAALVRCHDTRCPLAQTRPTVSIKAIFGFGAGALGIVAGIAMMVTVSTTPEAKGAPTPHATQSAVASGQAAPYRSTPLGDRSAVAWLAQLFDAPKPPQAEAPPPDPSLPDPRAASRVQSFRCEGDLPASRALVCTRWDLATADYNLGLAYQVALSKSRAPAALRRARAKWLAELDQLGADADRILRHIAAFQQAIAAG